VPFLSGSQKIWKMFRSLDHIHKYKNSLIPLTCKVPAVDIFGYFGLMIAVAVNIKLIFNILILFSVAI